MNGILCLVMAKLPPSRNIHVSGSLSLILAYLQLKLGPSGHNCNGHAHGNKAAALPFWPNKVSNYMFVLQQYTSVVPLLDSFDL